MRNKIDIFNDIKFITFIETTKKNLNDIQNVLTNAFDKAIKYHKKIDKTFDDVFIKEIKKYINSTEGYNLFKEYLEGLSIKKNKRIIYKIYERIIIPKTKEILLKRYKKEIKNIKDKICGTK